MMPATVKRETKRTSKQKAQRLVPSRSLTGRTIDQPGEDQRPFHLTDSTTGHECKGQRGTHSALPRGRNLCKQKFIIPVPSAGPEWFSLRSHVDEISRNSFAQHPISGTFWLRVWCGAWRWRKGDLISILPIGAHVRDRNAPRPMRSRRTGSGAGTRSEH